MFKLDGQVLPLDQPFTVGEGDGLITFPANWLRLSTSDERAAIGVEEFDPAPRADDRFYFVTDHSDGTSTAIERPLDEVKAAMVAQIKASARVILGQTSWYIERLMDPTSHEAVPQTVLDEREAVRARADELEAQINGCNSIAILAAVQITWPSAEVVTPA